MLENRSEPGILPNKFGAAFSQRVPIALLNCALLFLIWKTGSFFWQNPTNPEAILDRLWVQFEPSQLLIGETIESTNLPRQAIQFSALVLLCLSIFAIKPSYKRLDRPVDTVLFTAPFLSLAALLGFGSLYLVVIGFVAVLFIVLVILLRENFGIYPKSVAALSITLFLTASASIQINPISVPAAIGSFTLVLVWAIFFLLLAVPLLIKPSVGLVIIGAAAATFLFRPLAHPIENSEAQNFIIRDESGFTALKEWLEQKETEHFRLKGVPYPVFVVASAGGGIYAASHAYHFLSNTSSECPSFPDHLFAMFGVSGGAVGNSLFWANETSKGAAPTGTCADAPSAMRDSATAVDHLSPIVANLLFVETLRKFLPYNVPLRDRANALEMSLDSSVDQSMRSMAYWSHFWDINPRLHGPPIDASVRPVRSVTGKSALVHVSTNVASGNRYVFAPFHFSTNAEQYSVDHFSIPDHSTQMFLSTLDVGFWGPAVASAAFPYVAPSRNLTIWESKSYSLVDGGYFENTSLETALEFVLYLQRSVGVWSGNEIQQCGLQIFNEVSMDLLPDDSSPWDYCDFPISLHLVSIRDDPVGEDLFLGSLGGFLELDLVDSNKRERLSNSVLLDPLSTLRATAGARGDVALRNVRELLCPNYGGCPDPRDPNSMVRFFSSLVDPRLMELPLSWNISVDLDRAISSSVGYSCDLQIDNREHGQVNYYSVNRGRIQVMKRLNCPVSERLRSVLVGDQY
jgi:hypothetical protein